MMIRKVNLQVNADLNEGNELGESTRRIKEVRESSCTQYNCTSANIPAIGADQRRNRRIRGAAEIRNLSKR